MFLFTAVHVFQEGLGSLVGSGVSLCILNVCCCLRCLFTLPTGCM
jgi:hypothetical protein